eukprot:3159899-Rhodomonas_salina.1
MKCDIGGWGALDHVTWSRRTWSVDGGGGWRWLSRVWHGNGATPLYMAAHNGHVEAVDRLIAARCNVDQAMECDIGCWGALLTWSRRSADGGGGWRWLSPMWHGLRWQRVGIGGSGRRHPAVHRCSARACGGVGSFDSCEVQRRPGHGGEPRVHSQRVVVGVWCAVG